jgi:hypothetical protein
MKKTILIGILFTVYLSLLTGQPIKYETKINDLSGQLQIYFYSVDVIAYSLIISDENDVIIFEQKGSAIIPAYDWVKKNNVEFEEQVYLKNDSIIPVRQYLEECNCKNWLNFKIPKDHSFVHLSWTQDLIARISNTKPNSSLKVSPWYIFLKK